jgi:FkbM family methyltransferase
VRRLLQSWLLSLYRLVFARGLLRFGWGRRMFFALYDFYKTWLEAGEIDGLRRWVPSGGVVIDVGANVGFFTLRFADWVGAKGWVVAIEPEARNHAELLRRLARRDFAERVVLHRAVADRVAGEVMLEVNPDHPGDHKIGSAGVAIPALTVDDLRAATGRPVALIKIDVQGAEMRVLEGATTVLACDRPALFVEVDAGALSRFGTSTAELFSFLEGFGYLPHRLTHQGPEPMAIRLIEELIERDAYTDILFLAGSSMVERTAAGEADCHVRTS